mmetsp:Transcript_30925/g.82970  ORF Transcript_30925/g.82970 Transcript_30925/m.82970 type:complete len:93 (+) Transcript_30925:435-713(+)
MVPLLQWSDHSNIFRICVVPGTYMPRPSRHTRLRIIDAHRRISRTYIRCSVTSFGILGSRNQYLLDNTQLPTPGVAAFAASGTHTHIHAKAR